jgi:hypothetical protein
MKAYLIAAAVAVCLTMPAYAQTQVKNLPKSPSAASATTSTGEPTGPSTSQGSADHKGDAAGNTGQSTGPDTHPDKQAVTKQEKAHPDGSSHTSPQ